MLCDEIADRLPELVDAETVDDAFAGHMASCLRCQAELARYRKLLRALAMLRTRYLEPTPGALGATLVALSEDAERRAARAVHTGRRRLAYAGAIGGTVATAATVAALVAARRARRGATAA